MAGVLMGGCALAGWQGREVDEWVVDGWYG